MLILFEAETVFFRLDQKTNEHLTKEISGYKYFFKCNLNVSVPATFSSTSHVGVGRKSFSNRFNQSNGVEILWNVVSHYFWKHWLKVDDFIFLSRGKNEKKNQSNQPRWRKPSSFQFFSFNFFLVHRHFSLKQKITELIFVRLKILLRRRWWSASSFASAVGCGSTTTTTTMKTTTRSSGSAASAAGKACACPERWGEH